MKALCSMVFKRIFKSGYLGYPPPEGGTLFERKAQLNFAITLNDFRLKRTVLGGSDEFTDVQ